MILALVIFSFALAIQPSLGYSLGASIGSSLGSIGSSLGSSWSDYGQGFDTIDFDSYGPWNNGYRFWNGLGNGGSWGGSRRWWPYDGYGDNVEYDYYSYPIRQVDVGRDRLVRDFTVTETDNYVRDQSTYRYPTRYTSVVVPTRRIVATNGYGIGYPRSSVRAVGDSFLLRR